MQNMNQQQQINPIQFSNEVLIQTQKNLFALCQIIEQLTQELMKLKDLKVNPAMEGKFVEPNAFSNVKKI